jgi:hypothetical protein
MTPLSTSKKIVIFSILLVAIISMGIVSYWWAFSPNGPRNSEASVATPTKTATARATPTPVPSPTPSPTPTAVPLPPVVKSPGEVRGIEGDPKARYPGIPWVRLGYPTCGWGNLSGSYLRNVVDNYHKQGVRVLLTVCQGPNDARLYDPRRLADAAQGRADAVQCGNEQMKYDPAVAFLYIPPENFARFYDQCERAIHKVRPEIPVLLGSLDPHVGGVDIQPLYDQVGYLNQMQSAMNTKVRPGSNWNWRKQTLGLIDSWHNGWNNGYADLGVNSLAGLFSFWSQQFGVDLNSGQLGRHIWVVEATGCFKGCGVNPYSPYQVATSHIMALIVDVQTAIRYKVPIFYFSGKDFMDQGILWPIGILDLKGKPKPLRQDLPMGARVLQMTCGSQRVSVQDQLNLLVRMYKGCALPDNYITVLMS